MNIHISSPIFKKNQLIFNKRKIASLSSLDNQVDLVLRNGTMGGIKSNRHMNAKDSLQSSYIGLMMEATTPVKSLVKDRVKRRITAPLNKPYTSKMNDKFKNEVFSEPRKYRVNKDLEVKKKKKKKKKDMIQSKNQKYSHLVN